MGEELVHDREGWEIGLGVLVEADPQQQEGACSVAHMTVSI